MAAIYPSLIAADQLNLQKTIRDLEPYCQGFHCDVMDNHFVPNLSWGPLVVNALDETTSKPLWVHLMIDNPIAMLQKLKLKPTSIVSFHIESTSEILKTIQHIKEKKWRASIAISPKTAPERTFPFLHLVDQILVMSVEPGASGQQFIASSLEKIRAIATQRSQQKLKFTIGVDGGIHENKYADVVAAGGQELVIGSALFASKNPIAFLQNLKKHSE